MKVLFALGALLIFVPKVVIIILIISLLIVSCAFYKVYRGIKEKSMRMIKISSLVLIISAIPLCFVFFRLVRVGVFATKPGAIATVDKIGLQKLRSDAQKLNIELNSNEYYLEIQKNMWPRSFIEFKPIKIRRVQEGFELVRFKLIDVEEGILVVPEGIQEEPVSIIRSQVSKTYEKLFEGVYWYKINSR